MSQTTFAPETMGRPAAVAGAKAPATLFLPRHEGRIAYDDVGAGPLLVLVPSLGDLRQEYRLLVPLLVASGYRAVTMDLRGHGESTTGWSEYTNAAIGGDVLALIKALDAGPAVLIGTSMGAGAAAWAAAVDPEAVAGLVLISPFVRDVPMKWWKRLLVQAMIRTAFVGPWGPAAWGMYYASLYPTRKPADFAAYKAALVANLRQPGRLAALQGTLRATKSDVESRLRSVHAPTLVMMGTKDPDFADPELEALAIARIIRGKSAMIEGAGHYPHVEIPNATAGMLGPFLATVAPKAPRAGR